MTLLSVYFFSVGHFQNEKGVIFSAPKNSVRAISERPQACFSSFKGFAIACQGLAFQNLILKKRDHLLLFGKIKFFKFLLCRRSNPNLPIARHIRVRILFLHPLKKQPLCIPSSAPWQRDSPPHLGEGLPKLVLYRNFCCAVSALKPDLAYLRVLLKVLRLMSWQILMITCITSNNLEQLALLFKTFHHRFYLSLFRLRPRCNGSHYPRPLFSLLKEDLPDLQRKTKLPAQCSTVWLHLGAWQLFPSVLQGLWEGLRSFKDTVFDFSHSIYLRRSHAF